MSTVICPRCEGNRRFQGVRLVKRADAPCEAVAFSGDCALCAGVGSITAEHVERYTLARRFRESRRAAHRSLGDVADMLGVSPADISRAERLGIGDDALFAFMRTMVSEATP